MASDPVNELVLSSLRTTQEGLVKKKETIYQLDTQILELITDGDTLEDAILEKKDLQNAILEKINHIDTFIRMHTRTDPSTPVQTSSVSTPVVSPPSTSVELSEAVSSPPT